MRALFSLLMTSIVVFVSPVWADNASNRHVLKSASYMRVFGTAPPPQGYLRLCASGSPECLRDGKSSKRFNATPLDLVELDNINRSVNRSIQPATDQQIYGVEEHWTLPRDKGDCEDYVLLKRQLLMRRGWPASALLITVVRDQLGEGHAVLTARTDKGDFILDNKDPNVKLWHETSYRFLMRQSYVDPMSWVSLDPDQIWPTAAPATSQPGKPWIPRNIAP